VHAGASGRLFHLLLDLIGQFRKRDDRLSHLLYLILARRVALNVAEVRVHVRAGLLEMNQELHVIALAVLKLL
jgi:hypothetical protein